MWLDIKSCRLRCNHYRSKFGYFILVAGNSNELFSRLCCTVECPLLVSPFFSTCVCQDVWLATSSNITAYTLRTKEETDGKFFVKFALLFISRRHVLPFLNDVTCYFVSLFFSEETSRVTFFMSNLTYKGPIWCVFDWPLVTSIQSRSWIVFSTLAHVREPAIKFWKSKPYSLKLSFLTLLLSG